MTGHLCTPDKKGVCPCGRVLTMEHDTRVWTPGLPWQPKGIPLRGPHV